MVDVREKILAEIKAVEAERYTKKQVKEILYRLVSLTRSFDT